MKIAIVVSITDAAGMNMKSHLLTTGLFEKTTLPLHEPYDADAIYVFVKNRNHLLYTLREESIHAENLDKVIDADLFLFLTRHQSQAGIPSLSAHGVGNFGVAEYGGKDETLVIAPASYIRYALDLMERHKGDLPFEIVQEVTHHGPYLEKQTMFLEIGSTPIEWASEAPAVVQTKVVLDLLTTPPPVYVPAIGLGGQHTTTNFKKIVQKTNLAFGHIAAKYALHTLTSGLLDEMLEKTLPQEKQPVIVVDWKGLGIEKQRILAMLEKAGYKYARTDEF